MNYKTTLRVIIVLILFGFSIIDASAQVVQKIGENSFTINPKAVLELESTTKGFLPPRMTTTDQTNMGTALPAGLIVYVTNATIPGLQIWDGTNWVVFVDSAALAVETTRATAAEAAAILAASSDATTKATAAKDAAIQASSLDATTKATAAKDAAILAAGLDAAAKVLIEKDRALAAEGLLTTNLASKEDSTNKSTTIALSSNSDEKFPTEKAVIDYVNIRSSISIVAHTSDYTALPTDNTILCNTSAVGFKLSLPIASEAIGKIYVIRKTDSSNNALTFDALTLVDLTTITALNYPKTIRVQSDGSAWYVID